MKVCTYYSGVGLEEGKWRCSVTVQGEILKNDNPKDGIESVAHMLAAKGGFTYPPVNLAYDTKLERAKDRVLCYIHHE